MPGGKVGGVADVMRDLPPAIARHGYRVSVATPSYGAFHKLDGAKRQGAVVARFAGTDHDVDVYTLDQGGVTHVFFDHSLFVPTEPGAIYHSDTDNRPFATDATKFAFFGAVAAAWVLAEDQPPSVVHLNDWHAAFYLIAREFGPDRDALRKIRTVYSIHNLAYQGQRPLVDDPSSLEAWFPDLDVDYALIGDPSADNCINPMAFAIRASDAVNTVSPTYAREICRPSDPGRGFYGGEGLENELAAIASEGRLFGILNGCEYPPSRPPQPGWQRIVSLLRDQADRWHDDMPDKEAHALAVERIRHLPKRRPLHVMTSIGRLVQQKASLMLEPVHDASTALDAILDAIGKHGVLILIGSGEAELEAGVLDVARRHANFVFLNGYSETLTEPIYRGGDLFLMPSSFEPCGISQMLSMRDGQPCVVHGVGGLCDTVSDGDTGFVFFGDNPRHQAEAFVATVARALELRANRPVSWAGIAQRAEQLRFDWNNAARHYIEQVYEPHPD